MMSLVVMFFWSLFGVFGGLASFLAAMIFLYDSITDLDPYYYSVFILAFFLSSLIGYYVSKKIGIAEQEYTVSNEKIQEDINLLREHFKNRNAEVLAMNEKIESLLKLKSIADSLSLSLSREEVIKIVTEETFRVFDKDNRVLFFEINHVAKNFSLTSSAKGKKRKNFICGKGDMFNKWVHENMKSLVVKDIRKDFRFSVNMENMGDDAVSLVIKPLIIESRVLGFLRVDSPREAAFSQHELRIIDIIGELAAVAVENARLYCQTEELAIKDSLTGLYVYRYFMERVDEEIKRASFSGNSFALFMMDIDDFKKFNDNYGHISGDTVLKKIGRKLKAISSAGDIVARYGGEEFAFLALNSKKKEVQKLAEEIRKEISNNPVILRREKCFVTLSVGVALFPEDGKTKEDIVRKADERLYKAKAKGKNRVCLE
ncbi:MAG: sensor domain-containing diguanylate cyclase [Candidatus Omnitrophota bacterium]